MTNIKGKPLSDTLGEIQNGVFLADATEAIYELMNGVMTTRKPGKLTITLDIKPTGANSVSIDANLSSKVPEHDRPATTFFVNRDLSLQRRDPNQPDLPLQAVPDERDGPLRAVND